MFIGYDFNLYMAEMMGFNPERMDMHHERAGELAHARAVIAAVIGGGDMGASPGSQVERLETILREAPQLGGDGQPRYLLTSGLAVELMTGYRRDHHDIDLVIMNPEETDSWEVYGTDNVTPGEYWADMRFDPEFLAETRIVTLTRADQPRSPYVGHVHPAVILVQKASDCFGRAPRARDEADSRALLEMLTKRNVPDWKNIAGVALDALPTRQVSLTVDRLNTLKHNQKQKDESKARRIGRIVLGQK